MNSLVLGVAYVYYGLMLLGFVGVLGAVPLALAGPLLLRARPPSG